MPPFILGYTMFREIRRTKQLLSEKDCAEILNKCTSGVLALHGDNGYPYAVPLSFVYKGNCIYFHCALKGHKIDAIGRDNRHRSALLQKTT